MKENAKAGEDRFNAAIPIDAHWRAGFHLARVEHALEPEPGAPALRQVFVERTDSGGFCFNRWRRG